MKRISWGIILECMKFVLLVQMLASDKFWMKMFCIVALISFIYLKENHNENEKQNTTRRIGEGD